MCCLKYEQEACEDAIRRLPGAGSVVDTPEGRGVITDVNLLRETVRVRLDKETETDLATFRADEVKVLQKKKTASSSKRDQGTDSKEMRDALE